ncbi:MAG: PAS domain-containing protein [Sneathiella sp.]|nr:PAS domain-containing protein [Sneathiella sp.]
MTTKKFDEIDWVTADARDFVNYWRSLDCDGLIPHRSSFDPSKILPLLPNIAIYEVVSPEEIIYRLAGTEIVERIGHEVTGRNFLDFWEGDKRGETARIMNELVARPCGLFSELEGKSESGRIANSIAVGFPLLSDNDLCNRLVFYSSGFDPVDARIPREDQIQSLDVVRSTYIDLAS